MKIKLKTNETFNPPTAIGKWDLSETRRLIAPPPPLPLPLPVPDPTAVAPDETEDTFDCECDGGEWNTVDDVRSAVDETGVEFPEIPGGTCPIRRELPGNCSDNCCGSVWCRGVKDAMEGSGKGGVGNDGKVYFGLETDPMTPPLSVEDGDGNGMDDGIELAAGIL